MKRISLFSHQNGFDHQNGLLPESCCYYNERSLECNQGTEKNNVKVNVVFNLT